MTAVVDVVAYLVTWTTYGTWLPGDARSWRHRSDGPMQPQPLLEDWARRQMVGDSVVLTAVDRRTVEQACREHCEIRNWALLAVNARTNHVHAVIASQADPEAIRDQLKANCTRALRSQPKPLICERTWTRGGDIEALDSEAEIEAAVLYVLEAQDRKGVS